MRISNLSTVNLPRFWTISSSSAICAVRSLFRNAAAFSAQPAKKAATRKWWPEQRLQSKGPCSAPAHLSVGPERWKSSVFLCARTSRRNRKLPVCQPRPLIQVDCKVLTLRGGRTNQDQSRACEFFSVASVQRHFDSGAASGLQIQVQPQGWFGQSAYSVRWPPTGLRTTQASKFEYTP